MPRKLRGEYPGVKHSMTLANSSSGRGWMPGLAALVMAVAPLLMAQTPADIQLLNSLERATTQYFIDQADPQNYLMPVTWSEADGPARRASAGGTGLELAALCIADRHGWLGRSNALHRVTTILRLVARLQKEHPETKGLMYHYLNPDGSRYRRSNVGTDDGAKLILGALVARQYFHDPTVTTLVNGIYGAVNWQAWVDPRKKQCYEAWAPETGFSRSEWGRYSEGPLQICLLGLGSPTPGYGFTLENWNAWTRGPTNTYGKNPTYTWIGASPALFTHQYPQAFFNLRGLRDNSAAGGGISYWDNSTQATLAQWQWCQDLGRAAVNGVGPFPHWGTNLWGLTATVSASGSFNTWGGPVPCRPPPDGTLTPSAAACSLPFTPAQSLQTLKYIKEHYPRAWLEYGFVEAFNPETGWVARQLSTNQAGQTLLMVENYLTGLIWKTFMSAPEIDNALKLAQFGP